MKTGLCNGEARTWMCIAIGATLALATAAVAAQQRPKAGPGARPAGMHQRIVGGGFAPDGAYPWTAALLTSSGSQFCGGSLIAPKWVVTAAHCSASAASVRVGSIDRTSGGQVIRVVRRINHPLYSTQHDIALLELETPATGITPIPRGTATPAVGSGVRLLGWGQVTSPFGGDAGSRYLKLLDTSVIPLNTCTISPGAGDLCIRGTTTATACKGDSGGPAIQNGALVGATSRSGRNATYCGEDVIYTNVTHYKDWIDQYVGNLPANDGRVVTDVVLVASNASTAPAGPAGYALVGYWDVDGGGAQGTHGTSGSFMAALYARRQFPSESASCVGGLGLYASSGSTVPNAIAPAWSYRGMWDMDKGGGVGNLNNQWQAYMMGLYTTPAATGQGRCLTDVALFASNGATTYTPPGFSQVGWWDVDSGGAFGSQGSSGAYVATLSTKGE